MPKLVAPTLITSISNEELLPFYFVRVAGYAYHNCHPNTWYAPSRLETVIESFVGTGGTFAQMEPLNTFLPLQSRVLSPEDVQLVRKHCTKGAVHGIMAVLGMNGPNGGWAKTIPSFCLECVNEDIALCGTPFWNRMNLVPGLLFCSKHGRSLTSAKCKSCIDSRLLPRRHSRPGMHCGCGLESLPGSTGLSSALQEQEIELHRVTRLLLNPEYRPELTKEILASATRARSRELGLIRDNTSHSPRIREFFSGHPWRAVLERTRVLTQVQPTTEYLAGELVFRNPLQNIALLSALFGDWSNVEKMIEETILPLAHEADDNPKPTLRSTNVNGEKNKKRWLLKHRDRLFFLYSNRYATLRRKLPSLSHGELVRAVGGHALMILDRESLHQAGIDVPFYKLTEEAYEQIDIDLAEHILDKSDELKIQQFSGKIKKHVLLQDFGFGKYLLLKGHIPFSDAAIDLCVKLNQQQRPKVRARARPTKRTRQLGSAKTASLATALVQFASAPDNVLEERTLPPCEAP